MFLNGRWLGSDQKVGVGTKYSRPEGLSVSRADYRTYLLMVSTIVASTEVEGRSSYENKPKRWVIGRHGR